MSTPLSKPIRVLLVDHQVLVREALGVLIDSKPQFAVVAEAADSETALALVSNEQPDVIVLAVNPAAKSELESIHQLRDAASQARVIVLTDVRDPEAHRSAVRLGAMGLVFKDQPSNVLLNAIERVNAGEAWLDRSLIASVLSGISNSRNRPPDPAAENIARLIKRELEVVRLVGQGLKNKQIAERLFVSEVTVRHHLTSILSKLELSDRFDLALFAYRHHLADSPR